MNPCEIDDCNSAVAMSATITAATRLVSSPNKAAPRQPDNTLAGVPINPS